MYIHTEKSITSYDNLGINFWCIPKCGNTSTKLAFLKLNDPALFSGTIEKMMRSDQDDTHDFIHRVQFNKFITYEEATSNGYRNVSVVRNPIDRFCSAYRDFVFKRSTSGFGKFPKFEVFIKKARQDNDMVSFLKGISELDYEDIDAHFRPQSVFVDDCVEVFKLEHMSELSKEIHPKLHLDSLHSTMGWYDKTDSMLTDEVIDLIRDFDSDDFVLWSNARG